MQSKALSLAAQVGFIAALVVLATAPAVADNPRPSDFEVALLPSWCKVPFTNSGNTTLAPSIDDEIQYKSYWASGCAGVHHYCWGLVYASRAYTMLEENAQGGRYTNITQALEEMDYTLGHSSAKTCTLNAAMHCKAGEMLAMIEQPKKSEERYRKALAIDPKSVQAFSGLSDLYENLGRYDESVAILQQGIRANAKSTGLKKKLARLQARAANTGLAGQTQDPTTDDPKLREAPRPSPASTAH